MQEWKNNYEQAYDEDDYDVESETMMMMKRH